MPLRSIRMALGLVVALIVPIALGNFGVWRGLGAHPWWDVKTALIGAPVGCVVGVVLARLPRGVGVVAGVIVLALAIVAATYGKTQFAASYAEDAFAGKLWYFGWIGISAGLSAVLLVLLASHRRAR